MKTYPIEPVAAPRMTARDKWKRRPCVLQYYAFRDEVRARGVKLDSPCKVTFFISMPQSWSKRKKADFAGRPHINTPDIDNLLKALLDSVFKDADDAHIWSVWPEKRWAETGHITVENFTA